MSRLIALFAIERDEHFEIIERFNDKSESKIIPKDTPKTKTITYEHPSAIWFERKISDDFGIEFEDSFDKRPLLRHERFPLEIHPMLKSFDAKKELTFAPFKPYKYEAISGDGVFEVPVGPIHAGIIEPGHFHFSQAGEDMLHQEVRHFYKYRAIEKMVEGKNLDEVKEIVERISGNETIAYQIALRDIILQSANQSISDELRAYHAMLLELERSIHHLTDLGFIPNDAGFGSALAYCSALAEEARRVMKTLTNHRFGFGSIQMGAKSYDKDEFDKWLSYLQTKMSKFESWIMDIPSLWDRFDTTGILKHQKAIKYDMVGVVARASNVAIDRRDNEYYKNAGWSIVTENSGDVGARFKVRLKELFNSIKLMKEFNSRCSDKDIEPININQFSDGRYEAFVESSIGELYLYIEIKENKIERLFARDPSFINWQGLHLMMPGNIIADFPLINKSCDLSYAGNDL